MGKVAHGRVTGRRATAETGTGTLAKVKAMEGGIIAITDRLAKVLAKNWITCRMIGTARGAHRNFAIITSGDWWEQGGELGYCGNLIMLLEGGKREGKTVTKTKALRDSNPAMHIHMTGEHDPRRNMHKKNHQKCTTGTKHYM